MDPIFSDGFNPQLRALDDGWFGNGAYFSTNIVYAAHYIKFRGMGFTTGFKLPAPGHTAYVIGALLKPGRAYQVLYLLV